MGQIARERVEHIEDQWWLESHGERGRPHPSIVDPPARPPAWMAALIACVTVLSVGAILKGLLL